MTSGYVSVATTDFCKMAGRDHQIWQEIYNCELVGTGTRCTILTVSISKNGDANEITLKTQQQLEQIKLNNLQTRFRSILIPEEIHLKRFQVRKYEKLLRDKTELETLENERIAKLKVEKEIELPLFKKLNKALLEDFLNSEEFYTKNLFPQMAFERFEEIRTSFVKKWVEVKLGSNVDRQQAAAISSINKNTLVIARAGSGKTATLVNRAIFLNQKCKIKPEEILILAFNRDAAAEIKKRLKVATGKQFPNVMTFHSLAYSVVKPTESVLYDEPKEEMFNLSAVLQSIIDNYLRDPDWTHKIRALMVSYFRNDWEAIAAKGFHLSPKDMFEFRKVSPKIGLDGRYYKSFGEKKIADTLFEYGLNYVYEKNVWWNGINYRPDFTVRQADTRIIIEYFGMAGDPEYDKQIFQKRIYWSKQEDITLIEITPTDVATYQNNFNEFIISKLQRLGIKGQPLSEEEVWERIRDRAVDRFSKLISQFLGRARQSSLTPNQLNKIIESYTTSFPHEDTFLAIASSVYCAYVQRIEETGEDDFNGLLINAIEQMNAGNAQFHKKNYVGNLSSLRYIMIDEFQDFSELFYKCVSSVRALAPKANLFCVGDDWQAINTFAGSDLRYFSLFDEFFPNTVSRNVQTNYRSAQNIVIAGNLLMQGNGVPAETHEADLGSIELIDMDKFEPSARERHLFENQNFMPAMLRLIDKLTSEDKQICLLARTNTVPWAIPSSDGKLDSVLNTLRSHLPPEKRGMVAGSTIHKYKGQQADSIILIDFKEFRYPFIHPNFFFTKIFGDTLSSILKDELRLLYVALTRAKSKLYLVSDKLQLPSSLSSFVIKVDPVNWDIYPEIKDFQKNTSSKYVTVRNAGSGGGTFEIKELLKQSGYRWANGQTKAGGYWSGVFNFKDRTIEQFIMSSSWVEFADNVKIEFVSTGGLLEQEVFIKNGQIYS